MAVLSKEQQNALVLVGIKVVGQLLVVIAISAARKQLAKR
jgi:hypothetical protein